MVKKPRRLLLSGLILLSVMALLNIDSFTPGSGLRAFATNEGSTAFTPLKITQVTLSSSIYVLATTGCSRFSCLRFLRTNVNLSKFESVTPPPVREIGGLFNFDLDSLQFANVDDGYATVGESNPLSLYVTLNGARSWHQVTIQKGATIFDLTVTSDKVYAITALCSPNGDKCRDYRIARSSLNAKHWSSAVLPGSARFDGTGWGFFGKPGAYGPDVWLSEQTPQNSVIFFSQNSGRTFKKIAAPRLGSVAGCSLTAESTKALWAECPTGMQVSFASSSDAGTTWKSFHQQQFFGTGGGDFDPVSSQLAYLWYGGTGPFDRYSGSPLVANSAPVPPCSTSGSGFGNLVFSNVNDGVAICTPGGNVASSYLLMTTDGGHSWENVLRVGKNEN